METENKDQKLDRIVLDLESTAVISEIINQVKLELGDAVCVTHKSMANFIIKNRHKVLTKQELEQFKSENYDLIKVLKRATMEAIKAKRDGNEIDLNEVLRIIQTPSVNSVKPSRKPRTQKNKSQDSKLMNQQDIELVNAQLKE